MEQEADKTQEQHAARREDDAAVRAGEAARRREGGGGAGAGVGRRHRCAISSGNLASCAALVALDMLRVKLAALSPECGVLHKTSPAQGDNDNKDCNWRLCSCSSICGQYLAGKLVRLFASVL